MLELNARAICDFVTDNGALQFGDQVHESLSIFLSKADVAGTAAGGGFEGSVGSEAEGVVVECVHTDVVSAQIGDEDVFASGIGDSLVRMRCVLSVWVGRRTVQLESFRLDRLDIRGVADIP